jgi:hypothetical protein
VADLPQWQVDALARYGIFPSYGTLPSGRVALFYREAGIGWETPPPPAVGQVWAEAPDCDGTVYEQMIVLVGWRNGTPSYRWCYDVGGTPHQPSCERAEWPPLGAILVAGPGAPWTPKQEPS